MPKNVQMPDGAVIAFPDDMDDATIHAEGLKYVQSKNANVIQPGFASKLQGVNVPSPSQTKQWVPTDVAAPGQTAKVNSSIDSVIENILRPILPKAAAVAAAGPTAGLGSIPAYLGTDALLQHLKSKQDPSFLSLAMGAKPGGALSTVANTAEQAAILGAGQKILGGAWKAGKAFLSADQPEILKFLPTASQALKAQGEHPTTAAILKWVEDHLAPGAKEASLQRSGTIATKEGEKLAGKVAGRSPSAVANPQGMVQLITGELVPESEYQAVTVRPKTASVQPIKITENPPTEVPYTPIDIKPKPVTVANPVSGKMQVTPGSSGPGTIQYPGVGTTTNVTGPVEQVVIPQAYETLPGKVTRVPFATDPASMDKLLTDPERLQSALTRSQQAGLGVNVKQDIAGYRLSRIQQNATTLTANGPRIDPDALVSQFEDPMNKSVNSKLFNSQTQSNIRQFYKNVAAVQDKPASAGGVQRMMLYENGVRLPASLFISSLTGNLTPFLANLGITGLEIGSVGLAKLLTKPTTARLMLALANNSALGVSETYAARAITNVLSGTTAKLLHPDGSTSTAQIKNGKLVPLE